MDGKEKTQFLALQKLVSCCVTDDTATTLQSLTQEKNPLPWTAKKKIDELSKKRLLVTNTYGLGNNNASK